MCRRAFISYPNLYLLCRNPTFFLHNFRHSLNFILFLDPVRLLVSLVTILQARERLEEAKREAGTAAEFLIKKNVDVIALIGNVHTMYQKKHDSIVNSWKAAELDQIDRYR